jgi:hypothetical protein
MALASGAKRVWLAVAIVLLSPLAVSGVIVALIWLENMATVGVYGVDHTAGALIFIEVYLATAILWLLFGIPHRAFRFGLDRDGKGTLQRTAVSIISITATFLVSIYILLQHFGGGALSSFSIKALIIGDIFTIFLLPPIFRSIAAACWQRGVLGIFSWKPLMTRWLQAANELDSAFQKYYQKKDELFRQRYNIEASSEANPPQAARTAQHNQRNDKRQEFPMLTTLDRPEPKIKSKLETDTTDAD